jgi:hypothetical protein
MRRRSEEGEVSYPQIRQLFEPPAETAPGVVWILMGITESRRQEDVKDPSTGRNAIQPMRRVRKRG